MPKIIVKRGYITNVAHMLNYLEYSATKIEAQIAVLNDGSRVNLSPEDLLSPEKLPISKLIIRLEGGKYRTVRPERNR